MNRTWWTQLQTIAPIALGACTTRFAAKHPRDWRRRIRDLTELELYFHEVYKLELNHFRVAGGALCHGFRIFGRNWKINRQRCYGSTPEARWAAICCAFTLVESDERRVPFAVPAEHQPVRRQPKEEKKGLPQEDWRGRGVRA